MDWLTDPWQFQFMQRALLAGALVAMASSVVGAFVVIRGLAFLTDAVAHTSLAGAAIAFLAGGGSIAISLGAAGAAGLTAVGVSALTRARIREDTAIGIVFAALFAFGVLLISRTRNYTLELSSFLVGNILTVPTEDIIVMAILSSVVVVLMIIFYREMLFVAYDPTMAAAAGVPVALVQTGLMVLVALAAVAAFRLVGVALVMAMVVATAATAALVVRRVPLIMLVGAVFGVLSVVIGLYASFHADVAAGPAVVVTAAVFFLIVFTFSPRGLAPWLRRVLAR
ncbi:MAG: metal ABC transporter permease [Gemmatimonadetes bacterium]|nr:metal ABC transporter permease [Chloroflexota bacterium]MCY3610927.1 metal ABC transporter permease [Gemmatimonadota bacterium]